MNKLIRQYIRKIIISEMSRKAPLLNLNFSDNTEELTDTDLSRVELTQTSEPLDITKKTKIPTDLSLFYDDDDDFDDDDDDDFDIEDVSDFYSETEEDSESHTVDNPLPKAAYDPAFRIRDDMTVSSDPMGRTPPEIKRDVHTIADELEADIDKSQKSESQREAEFLKRMEDMIASGASAVNFPEDPEFLPSDDTVELPRNRQKRSIPSFLSDEQDTMDLTEAINDFVRSSYLKNLNKR